MVSGLVGIAAYLSAAWALEAGPRWLVFFVFPQWTLIFGGHLISGAAAVTGLALLLPPLLRRISRTWLRLTAALFSAAAVAAASVSWLVYAISFGLNAASSTYVQVTAEDGESVIVQHSGFDRRDYSVLRQKSPLLWEKTSGWQSAPEVFDPDSCSLLVREAGHLLSCGTESVALP